MKGVPIALATLGLVLTGCGGSSAGQNASQKTQPSSSSTGATSPSSIASPAAAVRQLSFQVKAGGNARHATIAVPDAFVVGDEWYVVSEDGDAFLGLWTAGQVQRDACRRRSHDGITPGPTVQDLADALVAQRSTRATTPEPVVLAGYAGLYLQLTGPRDLDKCDDDPSLTNSRGIYTDRQVDKIWILNADGQRLVVDASYGPTATTREVEALGAMVKSFKLV